MARETIAALSMVLDLTLVGLVGVGAVDGVRRGGIRTNIAFVVLVASLRVAVSAREEAESFLHERIYMSETTANAFGFVLIFVASQWILSIVGDRVAWWFRAPRTISFTWWVVDRITGVVPGAATAATIGWIVVTTLRSLDSPPGFLAIATRARVPEVLDRRIAAILPSFSEYLARSTATRSTSVQLMIEPGPSVTPPRDSRPIPDPGTELDILDHVNRARAEAGLAPLERNDTLDSVARMHSDEMLRLGYFDHRAPDETNPVDRLRAVGFLVPRSGENIAFGPSARAAHDGLMASPSHRANILNPGFARVGIGASRGAGGLMITQAFSS